MIKYRMLISLWDITGWWFSRSQNKQKLVYNNIKTYLLSYKQLKFVLDEMKYKEIEWDIFFHSKSFKYLWIIFNKKLNLIFIDKSIFDSAKEFHWCNN